MDKMLHMVLKAYASTCKDCTGECVAVTNELVEQKTSSVIAEFILKCDSRKKKKKHLAYKDGLQYRLQRRGT